MCLQSPCWDAQYFWLVPKHWQFWVLTGTFGGIFWYFWGYFFYFWGTFWYSTEVQCSHSAGTHSIYSLFLDGDYYHATDDLKVLLGTLGYFCAGWVANCRAKWWRYFWVLLVLLKNCGYFWVVLRLTCLAAASLLWVWPGDGVLLTLPTLLVAPGTVRAGGDIDTKMTDNNAWHGMAWHDMAWYCMDHSVHNGDESGWLTMIQDDSI